MRGVTSSACGIICLPCYKGVIWHCFELLISMTVQVCAGSFLYKGHFAVELFAWIVLHRNLTVTVSAFQGPVDRFPEIVVTDCNRHLFIVFEYYELSFTSVAGQAHGGIFRNTAFLRNSGTGKTEEK